MIGPYIMRSLGYNNTKKLFLTGEIFDADQAVTLNLIDKFVSTKDIINERNLLIGKLLLGGPKAQTAIKNYLQNIYSKNISEDVIKYAAEIIADLRVSEEGQKGIKAFLNKSKPDWQNDIT
jgi:methylglutaconyl-CoA hydratase